MAPSVPSQTTQISKVELPEWVDKASLENYGLAKDIGSAPLNSYQGNRVADMGSATKQGLDLISNNAGKASAGYNSASGIFDSIAKGANNLNPTQISAGQVQSKDAIAGMLKDTDLSPYMNPYTQNVIDTSLNDLDRTRQQAIMSNASAAVSNNAFGGSRQGLTDAVTNSETALKAGQLSAQLRADSFDKAIAAATGDINRQYDASTGNANRALTADQTNVSSRLAADQANQKNILDTFAAKTGASSNAAQGLMSAAEGSQTANLKDFAALMQGGQLQQGQQQRLIDDAISRNDEQRNYDIENLNMRLSALGMSPYGKTETTQKTTTGGSSGTDFGQMGLGIFSLLLGLSEDDTKTDKEKVGKVPGTDLDLWAYRYKKDPKTYPKVVGVMASDVEKKMPKAVHKVSGKRVINYGMIGEAMSRG